jgi:hypothetical protein
MTIDGRGGVSGCSEVGATVSACSDPWTLPKRTGIMREVERSVDRTVDGMCLQASIGVTKGCRGGHDGSEGTIATMLLPRYETVFSWC